MDILLIHGLGRTPLSMWSMGQALKKAGHAPTFFSYTTLTESFDEIVARLRDRLQRLSQTAPYGVVTHSMGGVLLRAALTPLKNRQDDSRSPYATSRTFHLPVHVVMLAPPNQSPKIARIANHLPPFQWFAGQSGQNLASPTFYAELAPLRCPYTIVVGTVGPTGRWSPFGADENDCVVSAAESKMYLDDDLIAVSCPHSFIMNNKAAQEAAVEAFSSD